MISELFPFEYKKSVYDIDYGKLKEKGYNVILFDLDNTLVHHGDPADDRIAGFFRMLHNKGFRTVIITDNDRERTAPFAEKVNSDFICDAEKPSPDAYLKAVSDLGADKSEAVVIGDQMFKDILAANKSGIANVMVKYIEVPGEKWPGFRRILEIIILFFWKFTRYCHRLGEI